MRCWITVLTVLSLAVTGCTEGVTSKSTGGGLSATTTVVGLPTTSQDPTTASPPSVSLSVPEGDEEVPWEEVGMLEVGGWVSPWPVCRGPHGMWLSPLGETAMLEIRNGSPVLWLWWSEGIAG